TASTSTAPAPALTQRTIELNAGGFSRRAMRAGASPPMLGSLSRSGASPVRCLWAFLRASLMRLIGLIREAFEIARRPAGVPVIYFVGLANESREEGFIAKIIDDPRNSAAGAVDFPE